MDPHFGTGTRSTPERALNQCARCQGIFAAGQLAADPNGNSGADALICNPCKVSARVNSGSSREGGGVSLSPLKRQVYFAKYTDLRRRLDGGESNLALHLESGETADTLGLTLEAIDHFRECVSIAPDHLEAAARLKALRRQAAATGETGGDVIVEHPRRRPFAEDAPFWSDLGGVLTYPFAGRGKGVLFAASIFFAVADIIAQVNVIGWLVFLCMWGYVACYQFDVIGSSGAGKKSPPDFPEVLSLLDSMVFPFFAYMTCGLCAFLPFIGVASLTASGTLPPAFGVPLALMAFVLGFFAFPMTLMIRGLLKEVLPAANPKFLLGSVGRIFPDYLVAFCAISVLWVAYAFTMSVFWLAVTMTVGPPTVDAILAVDGPRIIAWVVTTFLQWPVLLYVLLVQSHILGRVYRQGSQRLAWFSASTRATQTAQKMSLTLGLCAAGCALLVAGGAWGTYTLASSVGRGSSIGAPACPIRSGGTMTYFFENSDGPAGLITYHFDELSDGNMRVRAATLMAGADTADVLTEDVGIFDPDDGIWISASRSTFSDMRLPAREGDQVPFYGPRNGVVGRSYINTWMVRGEQRWQDSWDTYRVLDDDSTECYYDSETGVLVGRRFAGIGYEITEWLTDHSRVRNIDECPPPNRTFPR